MLTVAVYHRSVPNAKNPEKINCLINFARGVRAVRDQVVDVNDHLYRPTDVGVIQGWVSSQSDLKNHLALRNSVIVKQAARNQYTVAIDSNLFLYANQSNDLHYLRYSFNGIFPNTGIYCDHNPDPNRWQTISNRLRISIKDYRTSGSHILLCLQRNKGWSMSGIDVQQWVLSTVSQIRLHTDRPIVIRPHPGDKAARQYLDPKNPACAITYSKSLKLSQNTHLADDLSNCWAAVNYNSSSVVGAAIEGYPVFVTDPARSQCQDIANTDFTNIEDPNMPDRQPWLERLAMSHWSFDELMSGQAWSHMRKYCSK